MYDQPEPQNFLEAYQAQEIKRLSRAIERIAALEQERRFSSFDVALLSRAIGIARQTLEYEQP